jgi:hypothetical protein
MNFGRNILLAYVMASLASPLLHAADPAAAIEDNGLYDLYTQNEVPLRHTDATRGCS